MLIKPVECAPRKCALWRDREIDLEGSVNPGDLVVMLYCSGSEQPGSFHGTASWNEPPEGCQLLELNRFRSEDKWDKVVLSIPNNTEVLIRVWREDGLHVHRVKNQKGNLLLEDHVV